jgi:hypothetical protein
VPDPVWTLWRRQKYLTYPYRKWKPGHPVRKPGHYTDLATPILIIKIPMEHRRSLEAYSRSAIQEGS